MRRPTGPVPFASSSGSRSPARFTGGAPRIGPLKYLAVSGQTGCHEASRGRRLAARTSSTGCRLYCVKPLRSTKVVSMRPSTNAACLKNRSVQRNRGLDSFDAQFVQSAAAWSRSLRAVSADGRSACRSSNRSAARPSSPGCACESNRTPNPPGTIMRSILPGRGLEILGRVLGVDAALDRGPAGSRCPLAGTAAARRRRRGSAP